MLIFFKKALIFGLILLVLASGMIYYLFRYGDAFYARFTSPKQTSLILGNSRAAQGIRPEILNEVLVRNDIYNFSFTIEDSPYGAKYLQAIKKKLQNNVNDGIFILSVDPWSLSSGGSNPNDENQFTELKGLFSTVSSYNQNPNLEYIFNNFNELIFRFRQSFYVHLHSDGWLEVNVGMEETKIIKRAEKKVSEYKEKYSAKYHFSSVRLNYLRKTIQFLKKHGRVYLVRIPVSPQMLDLENTYCPDFDEIISKLASDENIPFKSWMDENNKYLYTDGNHLYYNTKPDFTHDIGNWIKGLQK
ncbi:MAG: hypothetical protein A2X64_00525 [Ignavibacteria bacterium GWF2_33_9]|nr:MAG: hypothetical protein A2X64_00525 [Ignavibacteria bacterium GWF2_33_9]